MLSTWRGTAAEYPRNALLHELCAKQAERTPERTAVVSESGSLSYAELHSRSNTIARRLHELGIGPSQFVGVHVRRSTQMIASMLGVLKAGAAILPLDPEYPPGRLQFLVEDAEVSLVLSERQLHPCVGNSTQVLYADEISGQADWRPNLEQEGESLAYLIYTSGSTGRPKGVLIPHRGICNRLLWMQDTFCLLPEDRVLQKTPIGFDVSIWEIFWPVMTGATLVLARPGGQREIRYMVDLIRSQHISVIHFVPTMLRAFLEEPDLGELKTLRHVICSGETLDVGLRELFFQRLEARLHNLYGPTEASIDVTHWEVDRLQGKRTVPIGRPIANTEIYVLDENLHPVPIGQSGELYIGGRGVAQGYHRRPELTADKFIAHPFRPGLGRLLYKTGDRARMRAGGVFEFLGRLDDQVKIRGHRIELAEVEAVLDEHPTVRKSVVACYHDPGDSELVAWVLLAEGATLAADELYEHVAHRLPDAGCPRWYLPLDRLPYTPNGKVDRRVLEEKWKKCQLGRAAQQELIPPATRTEAQLMRIWSAVLRVHPRSTQDSFFELGGNSITAAMIMSRVSSTFGVALPLRVIFDCSNIRDLARCIDNCRPTTVQTLSGSSCSEISSNQERLWFLAQMEPRSVAYNIPLGVQIQGRLDTKVLDSALNTIVARHESLRTTFTWSDEGPIPKVSPPAVVSLPVRHLPFADGDRMQQAIMRVQVLASEPFDLSRGPLHRWEWIPIGQENGVLAFVVHHIVFDEWSWTVFLKELAVLLNRSDDAPLSPLPLQFRDYVRWQNQQLTENLMTEQLNYWRRKLLACPESLHLQPAEERPSTCSDTCGVVEEVLCAPTAEALFRIGARRECTSFMVLLAAFKMLLGRVCEQDDVVVACPYACRRRAEAEHLIGFFVNTLLLRTSLTGDPTFTELLGRVRETALEAYTNQDVPFDRIVAAINPNRRTGELPLVRVLLNMRNPPDLSWLEGNLKLTVLHVPELEPKFDLKLDVIEEQQRIRLRLVYRPKLFTASRMHTLARQLVHVLEQVAAEPERRTSQYLVDRPA